MIENDIKSKQYGAKYVAKNPRSAKFLFELPFADVGDAEWIKIAFKGTFPSKPT